MNPPSPGTVTSFGRAIRLDLQHVTDGLWVYPVPVLDDAWLGTRITVLDRGDRCRRLLSGRMSALRPEPEQDRIAVRLTDRRWYGVPTDEPGLVFTDPQVGHAIPDWLRRNVYTRQLLWLVLPEDHVTRGGAELSGGRDLSL